MVKKDKCDLIITPRIMKVAHREFICPKFCGINRNAKNSIEGLPAITEAPANMDTREDIFAVVNVCRKVVEL